MVLDKENFDTKAYIERFEKSFANFLDKSPLYVQYTIVNGTVFVYDFSRNPEEKPVRFELDFSISHKDNIRLIKENLLVSRYPVFEVSIEKARPYTSIEIQKEMDKTGKRFSDVVGKMHVDVTRKSFRIEKVFNPENRIAARDLDSNELQLYQFYAPVMFFLKDVYKHPENAVKLFTEKAKLLRSLPDVKE